MKRVLFLFGALFVCLLPLANLSAQGVPAPFTSRLQPFLSGLSRPVLIRSANDGTRRLFIVQQGGIIKVLAPGSNVPLDFINLSSKITIPVSAGDERGLLGLTFHPDFETNGYFFVNYTRAGDGATVVARYTATNNNTQVDIASERILLTVAQPFSNHNGGMIEFGPDGHLYIGMGDGGSSNDPNNNAQNVNSLLGKFLRITPDVSGNNANPAYTNPADNPYVGVNGADEIWALGVRNPWRWSFDRGGTNQLWAADVGQFSVEEVDIITRGGNYGWRVYEGNSCTNNDPGLCTPSNYLPPVFTYSSASPSSRCSITGGYVYRGTQGALPPGAYVYGDYCTGEVLMRVNGQEQLITDTSRFLVSFGEDDNGEIYACFANGTIDKIVRAKASADFDGDLKTDISVFRPSTAVWYATNSSNGTFRIQGFGLDGDVPVPEDYDGDNITDIAVFRPSTGVWYYFRSSDSTIAIIPFGSTGDVPAAGDYDGDAKADLTVFRPSAGVWYTLRSSNGSFSFTTWGSNGDIPAPGDFDGDGKYDIAVFRPSLGYWYRLNSGANNAPSGIHFGSNGDIPATGDYDGDGKSDIAVFRPSNGTWYIFNSTNGAVQIIQWGVSGDVPVVGDYDGDAKDDIGVFRNGVWYVIRSSNGSFLITQFGLSGDLPAPAYDAP
jgi:glucose/arabinose dehydrogenase